MKPAYSPRVRIYRGVRHKVGKGACPTCGKSISLTRKGIRRQHSDTDGSMCPGSGVKITNGVSTPLDIDKVLAALPQHAPVRLDPFVEPKPRPYPERATSPGRCSVCGQSPRVNGDGTLRAHRMEPDLFIGPYCPGGREKGRP